MSSTEAEAVERHYARGDLGDVILKGLVAAGKSAEAPTPDDLAPVDQFHSLGKAATLEMLRLAALRPDMIVLDVGGGIGGPARTIATEVDCHVTVLDLSEEYTRVGTMLTERTGLAGRVSHHRGDAAALPFEDANFDAAWTQHSSMNIADKQRLYAEIFRVLRPGGRLAIYEVMAGPSGEPHYPAPWAGTPEISFLLPPEQMRGILRDAGFHEVHWRNVSAQVAERITQQMGAAVQQASPFGLFLVMPNFAEASRNHVRNLEEGRISVIQAVLDRP